MLFTLAYSEIALKGKNRYLFQNALIRNIKASLPEQKITVHRRGGRLLLECENSENVLDVLTNTFGIESVSPVISTNPDIDSIRKILSGKKFSGKIKVHTKRSDKSFPMESQKVNEIIGQDLVELGAKVDLKHPDHTIYIDILKDEALVYFERIKCPGGLPVGSSGRVLSLLSGGIDSPVASLLMMRRGCTIDYIHLHSFAENSEAKESKIMRIANKLKKFHPPKSRIFIAPYLEFYKKTFTSNNRREVIVFRRFLLRLAGSIAKKYKIKAIVTGDSLGQVASQTLENIYATNEASEIPVFRPLIAYNKQDIIDYSIQSGMFDLSVEKYKDCCSLVSHQNPSTRVKLEAVKRIEEDIEIEKIVEKTMEQMEVVKL